MTQPVVILIALVAFGIAAIPLGLYGSGDTTDDSERAVASPTETSVYEPAQAADSPTPTSVTEPAFERSEEHESVATEPESAIDSLFITYVCNDRVDPAYPVAVEQWGYLTHGGKELMCWEYLEGNLNLVVHHQELIRDSEMIPASELTFHDNNPEEWYRLLLGSERTGLGGPGLSNTIEIMGYADMEVMLQARTPLEDALTLHQAEDYTEDWVNWLLGRPTNHTQDFSTAGELLSSTLVSPDATHLAARMNRTSEAVGKHRLLESLVRSSIVGSSSHTKREAIMSNSSRLVDQFHAVSSRGEFSGPFDEWLLENHEVFLSQYWPDEDWTPAPGP